MTPFPVSHLSPLSPPAPRHPPSWTQGSGPPTDSGFFPQQTPHPLPLPAPAPSPQANSSLRPGVHLTSQPPPPPQLAHCQHVPYTPGPVTLDPRPSAPSETFLLRPPGPLPLSPQNSPLPTSDPQPLFLLAPSPFALLSTPPLQTPSSPGPAFPPEQTWALLVGSRKQRRLPKPSAAKQSLSCSLSTVALHCRTTSSSWGRDPGVRACWRPHTLHTSATHPTLLTKQVPTLAIYQVGAFAERPTYG